MTSKFSIIPFILAIAVTIIVYACSETTVTPPPVTANCDVFITRNAVSLPCTVYYSAVNSGSATANTLTFRNDGGLQSISNPVLPYYDTLVLNTHDTVSMSVLSTSSAGSISLSIRAKSSTGILNLSSSRTCGN